MWLLNETSLQKSHSWERVVYNIGDWTKLLASCSMWINPPCGTELQVRLCYQILIWCHNSSYLPVFTGERDLTKSVMLHFESLIVSMLHVVGSPSAFWHLLCNFKSLVSHSPAMCDLSSSLFQAKSPYCRVKFWCILGDPSDFLMYQSGLSTHWIKRPTYCSVAFQQSHCF